MQIPARSAPLVKIAIFDSITSKYYYIFKNLTSTKIFKNSRFFYVSYGKNTGNKTFLIFGPFWPFLGKYSQNSATDLHGLTFLLGPFCVMRPKNRPVGNTVTANWRTAAGTAARFHTIPPTPSHR
jgi:hypothetical protein